MYRLLCCLSYLMVQTVGGSISTVSKSTVSNTSYEINHTPVSYSPGPEGQAWVSITEARGNSARLWIRCDPRGRGYTWSAISDIHELWPPDHSPKAWLETYERQKLNRHDISNELRAVGTAGKHDQAMAGFSGKITSQLISQLSQGRPVRLELSINDRPPMTFEFTGTGFQQGWKNIQECAIRD